MTYPKWLPFMLGAIIAIGPVATDMNLPGFPAIETDLGGAAGSAQLTLAAWFAGLSLGQITQGSLSDRFGRRMPLLLAMAAFTLVTMGCAVATSIGMLCALRFLQAFAAAAGQVIPRAMVRDMAVGDAAARMMSQLILVMGLGPILAPILGGVLLDWFSWRFIFWVQAAYGALATLAILTVMPDTLPLARRVKLPALALLARYRGIAVERNFITHACMTGLTSFALFAYIGGSPDVFIEHFGFSPFGYAVLFGVVAASFMIAAQVNSRLLPRFGFSRLLSFAAWGMCAGGLVLGAVAVADAAWWALVPSLTAFMLALGVVNPNAPAGALLRHPTAAGSAAALMGTLQYGLGAVSGLLVGVLTDGTAVPMAGLMLLAGVLIVLVDRIRPKLVRVLQ